MCEWGRRAAPLRSLNLFSGLLVHFLTHDVGTGPDRSRCAHLTTARPALCDQKKKKKNQKQKKKKKKKGSSGSARGTVDLNN